MNIRSRAAQMLAAVKRQAASRSHLRLFNGKMLPLSEAQQQYEAVRRQGDSMAVDNAQTASSGKLLCNHYLANALAEDTLGIWALDAGTLNFLEEEIQTKRPRFILEFGAGVSTLCFARYMMEAGHPSSTPCVFSIEQNEWQIEKSRERLEELGLSPFVRLLHAPVERRCLEGIDAECYALSEQTLAAFFGEARMDWIVIDGPSGDGLTRFGTLPLVKEYASKQTVFFLDDALRTEEMEVANLWSLLPYVHNIQLCFRGKGIWIGELNFPSGERVS